MSQREQQLETELALTRAIVRADASANYRLGQELDNKLAYLRASERAALAVAAWRPYDD